MMVEAKINLSIPIFTEDFMHTISVEELENLDRSNITILDIRSEDDFRRGSLPGAIHVPMKRNLDEDRQSSRKRDSCKPPCLHILSHRKSESGSRQDSDRTRLSGRKY